MQQRLLILVLCSSFCAFLGYPTAATRAANPPRFVARFANGSFVESNNLSDWHSVESTPKLENQPLFDPANPMRWIVDRSQPPPVLPDSFVEFISGDRLPGTVIDFRSGDESLYAPLPPHLLVRYEGPTGASLDSQSQIVRVDLRFVRRVVWQQSSPRAVQPRTAFLRDGSFLTYRSIRWGTAAVSLLLDSGPRKLAMNELAEVDLAPVDYWNGYYEELALLSPDNQKRLLQCEATDGLLATTSLERVLPRTLGDAKDVNRWVLGIQPAWSLDLFWIWQGTVVARRSFAPHEVPLTRVPASRMEQRSVLGHFKPTVAINRNVAGGPLRAANRDAGWGLGVQAFSELEYEFPPAVRTIRSDFSIDGTMKSGGCVQPRMINASAGNAVVYQGPIVVGSENVLDTGAVGISGQGDQPRKFVLQVDPVLTNRPPNADPFDIRDQANWLDPVVELDQGIVKQQTESRLFKQNLAWRGWVAAAEPGTQLQYGNFFAESPGNTGEYRIGIAPTGNGIKLTRTMSLGPKDEWLVVDVVRTLPPGPPCKLSLKVGSAMPVEWDVPVYDKSRADFRPLIVSLAEARKANASALDLELRTLPVPEKVPLLWRAINIVEQHPMYFRLLDDDLPVGRGPDNTVAGQLDDKQKHSGLRSIQLPPASELRMATGRPLPIRERPQLGEYRFLRFALRKQGGGGARIKVLNATADRNLSYEAGANPPEDPSVKRITNQALPGDWQLFTRDLYGDFGNVDLTGLTVEFVGGEQGWIDHVYLARTQNDYDLIKK